MRLYLYALYAAKPRQLRARATRPVTRRRFPRGVPAREAEPVTAARELWASPAFEASSPPDASTRLGRFHRQYGDDVLAAARAADVAEARRLVATWIEAHPPRPGDAWHPYPLSTRVGNWIAALTLVPELASPELSLSLWRQLRRLERNVEDDVLGNHVIRNARALVLGGAAFGAAELTRRGIAILRRELPEQILRDGGHYERSPAYHLVVLRDLLEVQAVSPHSWLAEAIDRMRDFAAALTRPDGAPALFNDGTVEAPQLELPEPRAGLSAAASRHRGSCPRMRMPTRSRSSCGGAAARSSSTRARSPTSPAQTVIGSGRPARTRPWSSTALTSSGSGERFAAGRSRRSHCATRGKKRWRRASCCRGDCGTCGESSGRRMTFACSTPWRARVGIASSRGSCSRRMLHDSLFP
jgi:Heparinase II/III N-terminus